MKKLLVLFLASFIAGCITPKPLPMKNGMIQNFQVKQAISIKSLRKYRYNEKWAHAAIGLLTSELEGRGATIREGAEHELQIGVVSVDQKLPAFSFTAICDIDFVVKTGSGYSKDFISHDVSGNLQRACGFSLTKAVAEILNDEEILKYIGVSQDRPNIL